MLAANVGHSVRTRAANARWHYRQFGVEALTALGKVDEAYERYSHLNVGTTYLATFKSISKKYPQKTAEEILDDLVARAPPGNAGKWFAAAKDAGLFDYALMLAHKSPCDPKTLTRAARDFRTKRLQFAIQSGLAAVYWLVRGYGYEITSADVWAAYRETVEAARAAGVEADVKAHLRATAATGPGSFATTILARELQL